MRALPLSILSIFAHPDDEIGSGSTLAHYSDRGAFTVLACASRGEAATIYCEDCATRENLADVRTHELECACSHLGIAELRWLDWPDGGVQSLPREQAIGKIVALIREVRPDIIITHPEHGLYPHPDHLAMWEIVRAAYDAAARQGEYPALGLPWAVARLYTRAIPQSYFDAAPEFARYRVRLKDQELPFFGTPDQEISVTMRVAPWSDRRMAAWDCHRSQHNPEGAFTRMPEELRREMAEIEHFVLAASRAPLVDGVADDLLAGLETWGSSRPEGEPVETAVLRESLSVRRGYLAIYQEYARTDSKPVLVTLTQALLESEQEMIYHLAGALRLHDEPAGNVEADSRLVAQAMACRSTYARIQFLAAGARHAVNFYRQCQAKAVEPQAQDMWDGLAKLAEAQLARILAAA